MGQVAELQNHDIPEHIEALDARLREGLTEEERKLAISWSNIALLTKPTPANPKPCMRKFHAEPVGVSRRATIPKLGICIRSDHARATLSPKRPTRNIASTTPHTETIPTRKNGLIVLLPRCRTRKNGWRSEAIASEGRSSPSKKYFRIKGQKASCYLEHFLAQKPKMENPQNR